MAEKPDIRWGEGKLVDPKGAREMEERWAAQGSGLSRRPQVVVKTVKGEHAAQREIELMMRLGYELEGTSSRKVLWSPATGLFTRKQKHTLTFIKQ